MDPKLFAISVLLITILENYSTAQEFSTSSLVSGNSHVRVTRQAEVEEEMRNEPAVEDDNEQRKPSEVSSVETSVKKTKSGRKKKNRNRKRVSSNAQSAGNQKNDKSDESNEFKSNKKDITGFNNENIFNSNIENYITDATHNNLKVLERFVETTTLPQPQRQHRKAKRQMKKKRTKKYKPDFKYMKINRKSKKRNKSATDIPDKAEGILYEYQETNQDQEVTRNPERVVGKKIIKNKKKYNNANQVKEKIREKDKTEEEVKVVNRKNARTEDSKEFLEDVEAEVEETTKKMKLKHSKSKVKKVIYMKPNLRSKKYKPEFRYIRIDNEPVVSSADGEQREASEDSKTDSSETEESDQTRKLRKKWDPVNEPEQSQEYSADDDDELYSSDSSEGSHETRESDHDYEDLRRRRPAKESTEDSASKHGRHRNKENDHNGIKKSKVVRSKYHDKRTAETPVTRAYRRRKMSFRHKRRNMVTPPFDFMKSEDDDDMLERRLRRSTHYYRRESQLFTERSKLSDELIMEYAGERKSREERLPQEDESLQRKLNPISEYDDLYDSSPEEAHVKRSALYKREHVLKREPHKQKKRLYKRRLQQIYSNPPEETTAMDYYGDANNDIDKETDKALSYQVHENIVDVPDKRKIPGPIIPGYVVTLNQNITTSPSPLATTKPYTLDPLSLSLVDENSENKIVNIVQGMKDYFTVIGKGLYDTVKDILKDQKR